MSKTKPTGRWRMRVTIPIDRTVTWDTFRGLQAHVVNHVIAMGGDCQNVTTNKKTEFGMALEFDIGTPKSPNWDRELVIGWICNTLQGAVNSYSSRMITIAWPNYSTIQENVKEDGRVSREFWRLLTIGELPEMTTTEADEARMDDLP